MLQSQRVIVAVGLVLITACGLYPPWTRTDNTQARKSDHQVSYLSDLFFAGNHGTQGRQEKIQYALLTDPPVLRSIEYDGSETLWRYHVNMPRLLLQWNVIAAFTFSLARLQTK